MLGRTAQYFRIELPNLLQAFLPVSSLEDLAPIQTMLAHETSLTVFESPDEKVLKYELYEGVDTCHVLGFFDDSYYIRINDSLTGWTRGSWN